MFYRYWVRLRFLGEHKIGVSTTQRMLYAPRGVWRKHTAEYLKHARLLADTGAVSLASRPGVVAVAGSSPLTSLLSRSGFLAII